MKKVGCGYDSWFYFTRGSMQINIVELLFETFFLSFLFETKIPIFESNIAIHLIKESNTINELQCLGTEGLKKW